VALTDWLLDKSAASRSSIPIVRAELDLLAGHLRVCQIGLLEQLYSARSAADYDTVERDLRTGYQIVEVPPNILDRALVLQRDLAHHHGMWHRTAIPDLLIAETALYHGLGVVHVDADFDRIAEVRPLRVRRLRTGNR
jgi:predicted nucleic acid-binding protein